MILGKYEYDDLMFAVIENIFEDGTAERDLHQIFCDDGVSFVSVKLYPYPLDNFESSTIEQFTKQLLFH